MELNPHIERLFVQNGALNILLNIPLLTPLQGDQRTSKTLGRPKKINADEAALINHLLKAGVSPEVVAESFGISRASVYRYRNSKQVQE